MKAEYLVESLVAMKAELWACWMAASMVAHWVD